jgi:hypothetical protein
MPIEIIPASEVPSCNQVHPRATHRPGPELRSPIQHVGDSLPGRCGAEWGIESTMSNAGLCRVHLDTRIGKQPAAIRTPLRLAS